MINRLVQPSVSRSNVMPKDVLLGHRNDRCGAGDVALDAESNNILQRHLIRVQAKAQTDVRRRARAADYEEDLEQQP